MISAGPAMPVVLGSVQVAPGASFDLYQDDRTRERITASGRTAPITHRGLISRVNTRGIIDTRTTPTSTSEWTIPHVLLLQV